MTDHSDRPNSIFENNARLDSRRNSQSCAKSPALAAGCSIAELAQRNISLINQLEEAADKHRSAGEHFADVITRLAGSVHFVYWHIAWFGLWVAFNALPVVSAPWHFDPYPFTFLTFVVSLEAIFLSTFILISQNHENQLAQKRSHLDLQINLLSEQENSGMLKALARIEERLGIPVEQDLATLQEEIRADELSEQIEHTQLDAPRRETTDRGL